MSASARVSLAGAVGLLAGGIAGPFVPWQLTTLLGWDAAIAVFCSWVWAETHAADAHTTRAIATREDDSRAAADLVLIAASLVSLLAVGTGLIKASGQEGPARATTTMVSVLTVALSWLAVQAVYTLRYAHLYYLEGRGVDFNSEEEPDYKDFAYLAFTVGMTFQVSDTNLTSRPVRRAALRHALLSYLFGIAIIATTVNVVAGLLGH